MTADEGERWTIRNVSREAQEQAKALARRHGVSLGALIARLIGDAAESQPDSDNGDASTADRLAALEARIAALEARERPRPAPATMPSSTSSPASPAGAGRRTKASSKALSDDVARRGIEMLKAGRTQREIAEALGVSTGTAGNLRHAARFAALRAELGLD